MWGVNGFGCLCFLVSSSYVLLDEGSQHGHSHLTYEAVLLDKGSRRGHSLRANCSSSKIHVH
jgi:hypothetical protein